VPIKAYMCRVYNWHTGPRANLNKITVPTKFASSRASTRLPLVTTRASVYIWSASYLSVGTLKYPTPRSTSRPRCFLSSIGIKPLLRNEVYLGTCFEAVSFESYSTSQYARTPLFWKKRSSRYGRTLIPISSNTLQPLSSPYFNKS
jgi:hypothetical protein